MNPLERLRKLAAEGDQEAARALRREGARRGDVGLSALALAAQGRWMALAALAVERWRAGDGAGCERAGAALGLVLDAPTRAAVDASLRVALAQVDPRLDLSQTRTLQRHDVVDALARARRRGPGGACLDLQSPSASDPERQVALARCEADGALRLEVGVTRHPERFDDEADGGLAADAWFRAHVTVAAPPVMVASAPLAGAAPGDARAEERERLQELGLLEAVIRQRRSGVSTLKFLTVISRLSRLKARREALTARADEALLEEGRARLWRHGRLDGVIERARDLTPPSPLSLCRGLEFNASRLEQLDGLEAFITEHLPRFEVARFVRCQGREVARVLAHPAAASLRAVHLETLSFEAEDVEALLALPVWGQLETLRLLSGWRPGGSRGPQRLLRGLLRRGARLRTLEVTGAALDEALARQVAALPMLEALAVRHAGVGPLLVALTREGRPLSRLELQGGRVDRGGVEALHALVAGATGAALRALEVTAIGLPGHALTTLLRACQRLSLEQLSVTYAERPAEGWGAALAEGLPATLRELSLTSLELDDDDLVQLTQAAPFAALESLALHDNLLGPRSWRRLGQGEPLALRQLGARRCRLDDDDVTALLGGGLGCLRELELEAGDLSPRTLWTLLESSGALACVTLSSRQHIRPDWRELARWGL